MLNESASVQSIVQYMYKSTHIHSIHSHQDVECFSGNSLCVLTDGSHIRSWENERGKKWRIERNCERERGEWDEEISLVMSGNGGEKGQRLDLRADKEQKRPKLIDEE